MQPFSVHEIGIHEDVAYYAPPKKTVFSRNATPNEAKETQSNEEPQILVQQLLTTPLRRDGDGFSKTRTRGRGRGRGRGRNGGTVEQRNPVINVDSESNSEEEENKKETIMIKTEETSVQDLSRRRKE